MRINGKSIPCLGQVNKRTTVWLEVECSSDLSQQWHLKGIINSLTLA